jgi:hypothetical protein
MRANKKFRKSYLTAILFSISIITLGQNCLYKNPLCFYNTDVLGYLKVMHQTQQYEKMVPFFYGPFMAKMNRQAFVEQLAEQDFGYSMKRISVKEISSGNWSLTYQRTLIGTNTNFKIKCALVNDTCRVYLDDKSWKEIFLSN